MIEKIIINQDDIKYLFENSFADTLNQIFSRNIYNLSESEYPIFAFVQKLNIFYIYEDEDAGWKALSRENLIKFLNRVHMKLHKLYGEYKKANSEKIQEDERFSILCDKTSLKMMSVDFRQETILGDVSRSINIQDKRETSRIWRENYLYECDRLAQMLYVPNYRDPVASRYRFERSGGEFIQAIPGPPDVSRSDRLYFYANWR